jgi:DNA-binding CsgD family transcriptional regulator
MIELLDEALAEAAGDDARSARILAFRSLIHMLSADVRAALADARTALEKAERVGDPTLLAVAIAQVGHAETWTAEITPALLERGTEIEQRLELHLGFADSPRFFLARLLVRLGELDRARALLGELDADAESRGDEHTRFQVNLAMSMLEWYAGRWDRALDHAGILAHELGEPRGMYRAWVGRVQALVEADLGLVEEARASAEEGLRVSRSISFEYFVVLCLGVLGRVELALGNLEGAAGYLRDLPGRLLAGGLNDPSQPVWSDAIETLTTLGELELAGTYLESYELHAQRFGSPLAMEGVLRCRGLLTAAEGDLDRALATFELALSEQPEPVWPFERARTLLCLGMVRRQAQQKRAARETLEQALAIFEELGARLWAEKARAELKRISGRRTSADELTETEQRVAELAAQGRTNKEIAAELFMGVSTVEAHLSRVYRKLGLRSRTELAGRITPRDEAFKLMDEGAQV